MVALVALVVLVALIVRCIALVALVVLVALAALVASSIALEVALTPTPPRATEGHRDTFKGTQAKIDQPAKQCPPTLGTHRAAAGFLLAGFRVVVRASRITRGPLTRQYLAQMECGRRGRPHPIQAMSESSMAATEAGTGSSAV